MQELMPKAEVLALYAQIRLFDIAAVEQFLRASADDVHTGLDDIATRSPATR